MTPRYVNWTRDELILALDLYFRFPPSHISKTHPEVIALSRLLNDLPIHPVRPNAGDFRNPNGVYMKICNFLRLDPSYSGKGLAAGAQADEEVWAEFAHDRARLQQVAAAIRSASVKPMETDAAEVGTDDEEDSAPEGRLLLREHKVRERNSALVRKKKTSVLKQIGVLGCEVCNLVFGQFYGTLGEGFIECHHIVPVSQLRPGQVTHLSDLTLVCANCHRMLHRGGDLLTIDALQAVIRQERTTAG